MNNRGASEVLSFALVFSLVVMSVALVTVSGLDSLQSARDAEQMNNAERAYDVLADNMADIHQRGAPSRATEVSLGRAQLQTGENVTMNVSVRDGSGSISDSVVREVRPIVYSGNQDRELVYEGGAVFRVEREGGLVLDEPPLVARSSGSTDRVLAPVVATQSSSVESAGGSTVLVRANARSSEVSISDRDDSYTELYLNISSPRQALWDEYLDGRTDFDCEDVTANGEDYLECEFTDPQTVHVVVHEIGVNIER